MYLKEILCINKVTISQTQSSPSMARMSNSILLRDSIYKLYANTVYLFLRDVKLLLRDSIYKVYKLYMNKVYLPLRDAKLLLRDQTSYT